MTRRWTRNRRDSEDGYVLATAVALMFITILTVMSVVTVQLSNIAGTRRAAGQLEGRFGGEQALDQSFTAVLQAANASTSVGDFAAVLGSRTPPIDVSTSGLSTWNWYEADLSGICADATGICVHFSSQTVGTTDFLVEVTTRARCSGGSIVPATGQYLGGSCVVTKYQQRVRKKQFFDYLSMTNAETISGSWVTAGGSTWTGSAPIAYVSGDEINGPVRTNGQFSVCAASAATGPKFQTSPEAVTPMFNNPSLGANPACVTTALVNGTQQTSGTVVPTMPLPSSTSDFVKIVTSLDGATAVISSCIVGVTPGCTQPVELELFLDGTGAGKYRVRAMGNATAAWGPSLDFPASRVLVVDGDVLVHGTLEGRLTIATVNTGSILVNGDLLYKCLGINNTFRRSTLQTFVTSGPAVQQAQACAGDSLGLIASRNISVLCTATVSTPATPAGLQALYETQPVYNATTGAYLESAPCLPTISSPDPSAAADTFNRYAVGAWMALGECGACDSGVIATQRWATAGRKTDGTVPNLYYYGSMTSKYRPVFGLATQSSAGGAGSSSRGLVKKFRHDAKLRDRQPPYFLEPTTDLWERVDLVEVAPCGAGLFGQKPQGAGC